MAKDIYWNNVVCLLHCDDLFEVVTQTNATAVGSPSFDTTVKAFGTASLRVTANNYITLPDSDKWDFGTGAFTMEFLMRFGGASNGTYRTWLGHSFSTVVSNYPYWYFKADYYSRPQFFWYDSGGAGYSVYAPSNTTTDGNWYAVCLQRDSDGQTTFWCNRLGYTNAQTAWQQSALSQPITGGNGPMIFGSQDADMWLDEIRITKGVARYTTATYAPQTEPFPELPYEIFTATVSDGAVAETFMSSPGRHNFVSLDELSTSASDGLIAGYPRIVSDPLWCYDVAPISTIGRVASVAETTTIAEATSVRLGTIIRDFANLADSLGIEAQYTIALLELVRAQDALAAGRPVTIQDTASVSWALGVVQGAALAEKLGLREVLNYPVRYRLSASDAVRVYDALARFLHFDLAETISTQDTMSALSRHMVALSQSATASDAVTPRMLISAVAKDDAVLDDAFNLHMIYRPEVHEQVTFTVMFASPSGGVTTWAVNTRTGAVTEYENYAFNSFALLGQHYLGASASGLYALDGDDDAGTPTVARLKSGYAQFGSSRFTAFAGAYLGIRGDGNIFLKLDTGDGKSYTYKTVIQDQQTTKVRLGKGLRARYFSFELITEGQDFDLDNVEFLPLVAQRRV